MMKTEILKAVRERHSKNKDLPKILEKIESELTILSGTEGLEAKNNLETFYQIWKNHSGEVGHSNEINSWTAYFLGITNAKPTGGFLPTRRAFARAGFPDIDTDFDYENRDRVYAYIIDKYGRDNVGNIGTHGLLKFKSCVTRVAKALDLASAFHKGNDAFVSENAAKVSDILSPFPKKGLPKIKDALGESHLIKSFADAFEFCDEFRSYVNKYDGDNFKGHCEKIEGLFSQFGSHAAGIVVSDVPLDEIAPLRNAKKGVLATQYPNEDLEALGLIKFDVLALSTLSVIKHTVEKIKENWGIEIDLENLPMNDDATLQLYREGNLGGVFQCENYGMQKTMREIGVDRFSDVIAALALYRPGPMDNIPQYCARKNGEEAVSYWHPSIEKYVKPYLETTYGVLCFQEQVMQICNALAGFTITDGYIMIKAIGKKKVYLMEKFEKQFVAGCEKNGVPPDVAQQYWDRFITPFASYGFNLAHSACYGYNSYTTAYLKANYPDEFMCSLFDVTANSSVADKFDKVLAFEREFKKKMNVKILSRDINKSKSSYVVEKRKDLTEGVQKSEIRPSLLCKGVSLAAAQEIEKHQPYKDLRGIVEKTSSRIVDVRTVQALAAGGYFGKKKKDVAEEVAQEFRTAREDVKKTRGKKCESVDIFA